MLYKRKSIFDVLREAEDDENQSDVADNQTDPAGEEAPSPEESSEEGETSEGENDEGGEDFSIDTSLNADEEGGEDDMGGGETDDTSSTDTSSSSSIMDTEDEPVQGNTDVFASLSAEEQAIKIKELKRLYNDLYTSIDDLLTRINTIDPDEDMDQILSRSSKTLYNLRRYVSDYIINNFAQKSFIENDITYNRFLGVVSSVANIISDLAKERAKKLGISDKK